MPIYIYQCGECKGKREVMQSANDSEPMCCGLPMSKQPTSPALIHIDGLGYNARRKFVKGTAPGTTRATKEWTPANPVPFQ